MIDRVVRTGLSLAWNSVVGPLWSPRVVRAIATVVQVIPSPGAYRVRYKGSYLYATSADRFVALNLWKYGVLEQNELRFAQTLIRPGMRIVDVGGNIGFHALEFARWTGPAGTVDVFEPAPDNYPVLERNIESSGLTNITAHQIALSDKPGYAAMYLSPVHRGDHRIVNPGDGRATVQVRTTTMDALYGNDGQRIDFVKIDAQGAEYLVLAGMREVFRKHPALIVMLEFSPRLMSTSSCSTEELIALVASFNRRIRVVDHKRREYIDCSTGALARKAAVEPQIDILLTAR